MMSENIATVFLLDVNQNRKGKTALNGRNHGLSGFAEQSLRIISLTDGPTTYSTHEPE